jgi:hypothetical protein
MRRRSPILDHRQRAFARAIAEGSPKAKAQEVAGYKPNRAASISGIGGKLKPHGGHSEILGIFWFWNFSTPDFPEATGGASIFDASLGA